MWQIIKDETNKNTRSTHQNVTLKLNNKNINDPVEIANYFNNFFTSIGNSAPKYIPNSTSMNLIENTFFLRPINPKETYDIIKK